MERLVLSSSSTRAKIIGTIVSVTGALVLIFYKGPTVLSASSGIQPISLHQPLGSSQSNWIIGSLLIATGYLLYSIWNIIQTQVMKMYPAEFIVVFFCYVCSTIVLAPICFIAESNWSSWRLGADVTLVAVIYSGVFGYCLTSIIRTWGLRIKGPVFVATFKPLSIVIAATTSFIFLGDALHLGSVIGAVIICTGFYTVLWGKAKEEEMALESDFGASASSSDKTPLLRGH